MKDLKQKILTLVNDDLEKIELAIKSNLKPYYEIVSQIAGHLLFAGGKRMRPLLVVLSARICGYEKADIYNYSASMEYLHAATLLHDDVVDQGGLRRGKKASHFIWGPEAAVLTGDFLLARALSLVSETGSPDIIFDVSRITEDMSQGEIFQLFHKNDVSLTEEQYLEVIRRKTAVLMEGACRIGALVAKADKGWVIALGEYGVNVGIAFQMADDLLDYTADAGILGKEPGADLKEGKLTLPVIYALKQAKAEDRKRMEEIIQKDFNQKDFHFLVSKMNAYGGIQYVEERAKSHVLAARQALDGFPASKTRELLQDIADYALVRKS